MKKRYCIIFYLTIVLSSCGIKLGRNDRIKRNLPAVTMQNFLYAYTEKNGFREWEVKASQAHTYEDSDTVFLYNLTMTLFSEKNEIKSVLVANKGKVQQSLGNLIAEGEVQVFSANKSILQTEKIYWDQNRELFYSETNKLVVYIRDKHKVTGYDMVSDSLLENIEMDNSVGQIDINNTDNTISDTNNSIDQFEDEFIFPEDTL